jgi:hypothetical protein
MHGPRPIMFRIVRVVFHIESDIELRQQKLPPPDFRRLYYRPMHKCVGERRIGVTHRKAKALVPYIGDTVTLMFWMGLHGQSLLVVLSNLPVVSKVGTGDPRCIAGVRDAFQK